MAGDLYVLYESAAGYALFEVPEHDEIATLTKEVQKAVGELSRFSKMVKLKAFAPFTSSEDALANANAVSEGQVKRAPAARARLSGVAPRSFAKRAFKFAPASRTLSAGVFLRRPMAFRVLSRDMLVSPELRLS